MLAIVAFPCGPCGCAVYATEPKNNTQLVQTKCGGCEEKYTVNFKDLTIYRASDNKTYPLGVMNLEYQQGD